MEIAIRLNAIIYNDKRTNPERTPKKRKCDIATCQEWQGNNQRETPFLLLNEYKYNCQRGYALTLNSISYTQQLYFDNNFINFPLTLC